MPSVGVMLFALPVGGDNIWAIGRGIPWGNHGYLPVVTSWHTLQIGLYIYLVCMSLPRTSQKLCMGPGPPKVASALYTFLLTSSRYRYLRAPEGLLLLL